MRPRINVLAGRLYLPRHENGRRARHENRIARAEHDVLRQLPCLKALQIHANRLGVGAVGGEFRRGLRRTWWPDDHDLGSGIGAGRFTDRSCRIRGRGRPATRYAGGHGETPLQQPQLRDDSRGSAGPSNRGAVAEHRAPRGRYDFRAARADRFRVGEVRRPASTLSGVA